MVTSIAERRQRCSTLTYGRNNPLICRHPPLLAMGISEPPLPPTQTFQLGLYSGAVAGTAVDVILYPLDTLKTRLQVAHRGATHAIGTLFRGLYSGILPALLASAPCAATFFGTYDITKTFLNNQKKKNKNGFFSKIIKNIPDPLIHMIAAAAGDITSSTVRSPFEVVKQRLQATNNGMKLSTRLIVQTILRKEGLGGLFRGYGALVLRELPFDGLQFPIYEFLKTSAKNRLGRNLDTWESSACGSVAGGISAAITTPLDVIKTRLMTQGLDGKYEGLIHGLKTVAREEGIGALFSGITPRVAWISLGGAIFFGGYEATRAFLLPKLRRQAELVEMQKEEETRKQQ